MDWRVAIVPAAGAFLRPWYDKLLSALSEYRERRSNRRSERAYDPPRTLEGGTLTPGERPLRRLPAPGEIGSGESGSDE